MITSPDISDPFAAALCARDLGATADSAAINRIRDRLARACNSVEFAEPHLREPA